MRTGSRIWKSAPCPCEQSWEDPAQFLWHGAESRTVQRRSKERFWREARRWETQPGVAGTKQDTFQIQEISNVEQQMTNCSAFRLLPSAFCSPASRFTSSRMTIAPSLCLPPSSPRLGFSDSQGLRFSDSPAFRIPPAAPQLSIGAVRLTSRRSPIPASCAFSAASGVPRSPLRRFQNRRFVCLLPSASRLRHSAFRNPHSAFQLCHIDTRRASLTTRLPDIGRMK
jgi:hypothetical protein